MLFASSMQPDAVQIGRKPLEARPGFQAEPRQSLGELANPDAIMNVPPGVRNRFSGKKKGYALGGPILGSPPISDFLSTL
jgi:hypothetical protein